MTHKTSLGKSFRIDKGGKVVRDERRLDVSMRLKRRASKRIKVARRVIRHEASP